MVFQHASFHSVVVPVVEHRTVSRRTHRLRLATSSTSVAAVLGRSRQTRHASSTTAHQLPAVLQLVRPTVWHRVSWSVCGRIPTSSIDRLGKEATCGEWWGCSGSVQRCRSERVARPHALMISHGLQEVKKGLASSTRSLLYSLLLQSKKTDMATVL